MTKDQWLSIFRRELEESGVKSAADVLYRGLMRELASELARQAPDTEVGVGYCFAAVEEKWKHVATETDVLKLDGWRASMTPAFADAISAYEEQVESADIDHKTPS